MFDLSFTKRNILNHYLFPNFALDFAGSNERKNNYLFLRVLLEFHIGENTICNDETSLLQSRKQFRKRGDINLLQKF